MAVLLLVAAGAPAMAQDTPGVEIGAGYAYLRDKELDDSFPLGWFADIAGNVSPWLGLVGELGGSYKTVDSEGVKLKLSVHTLMGGVRLARRGDGATAYIQVLAGAARGKVSFEGVGETDTNFAVQPGVGVDIRMSHSLAIRVGGDFRRIYGENDPEFGRAHTDEWRLIAGLVFH
jgi:opacity protein-like surface antigen